MRISDWSSDVCSSDLQPDPQPDAPGRPMRSLLLATAMAATPAPAWHDGLDWHGVHVGISRDAQHNYTLAWPYGQRVIAAQPLHAETASALFDGLFAMAQDDLAQDSVSAIRDGAFEHGQPIHIARAS